MARLTYAERQRLPSSAFVYPRTRRYPIEDLDHGRNAIARAHQFGSSGTIRTVEAAVHRRFPGIEIERHNPDLVGDVMSIGLLFGGVILGAGWLKAGGANAIGDWVQSLVPAPSPSTTSTQPSGRGAPTPVSPAPGTNGFNFNADATYIQASNDGTLHGHAGFGHTGPGGVYAVTIFVRNGGVGGIGVSNSWGSAVYQAPVQLGNDPDWTGYGVDFANVSSGLGVVPSMQALFFVDDGSGAHVSNAFQTNVTAG